MSPPNHDNSNDRETDAKPAPAKKSGPVLNDTDVSRNARFPARKTSSASSNAGLAETAAVDLEHSAGTATDARTSKPLVVDVEFENADIPRNMLQRYGPNGGLAQDAGDWPVELKELLNSFGWIRWERTFPVSYSWEDKEATKSSAEKAIEAGRDRFISFYFPRSGKGSTIAKALRTISFIRMAAPGSGAVPASALTEPFTGVDDQANPNHFCDSGRCFENQWYLFRCGVDRAWQLIEGGLSGKGVVIADIDWGFSPTHQDLSRIEFRHNTIKDDDANPQNDTSIANGGELIHGTAVLGLAGAAANGIGIVGVAHEADLWAVQAGSDSITDHRFWVEAIELIRKQDSQGRRKVMILEIQTPDGGNIEQSLGINQAIKDAIAAGVVVCVPAGNAGMPAHLFDDGLTPIPETGSILVGATSFHEDSNINAIAEESNFGERVVVYAPGDPEHDVTCCPDETNRGYTNRFGGTSGATAKVAGVAALMLQANKNLTHENIRGILRRTGRPVANEPSGKFLDAHAAVREALNFVA